MEIVIVSIILVLAIFLLVSEKLPMDLTAIGIMVALMVFGLLSPRDAMAGFANPAPLTVGALFIVSRGLMRTGSLDFLSDLMIDYTSGNSKIILLLSLIITGVLSAFINNTPVVVLFMSVILAVSARFKLSPSQFLIPISFVSILAGTSTLIGTSTNIIVSDLATTAGLPPIGMFELSALGGAIAVVGALVIFLAAPRLLPENTTAIFEHDKSKNKRYISELIIRPESPLVGKEVFRYLSESHPNVEVFEVIHGAHICQAHQDTCPVETEDILLVKATAEDLVSLLESKMACLPTCTGDTIENPANEHSIIAEIIVPPGSRYIGRKVTDTHFAREKYVHLIGVQRRNIHYSEAKISKMTINIGDVLLIQCPAEYLENLRAEGELIIIDDVLPRIVNRSRAPIAIALFLAMVACATFGIANILVCAMTAAFLMLLTGCLNMREAYSSVDVKVLLLIIGTIALGSALQKTGAADLYAAGFLTLFHGATPQIILSAIIVLTSLLSHFLSNNSTAVLLVPIGLSTAASLGVDPRPFIIGICFGASACYATPIGYQTNLLVLGPGGYKFGDFFKLGMLLNVIVWIAASLFIPTIWPF